jgi:hypothetical protein
MSKATYEVGGELFENKSAIYDRCKYILNNSWGKLTGQDSTFMDAVFRMHPRYEDKRGSGDYSIHVVSSVSNSRQKMFLVHQADGSIVDFSYVKVVNPISQETRIKKTLRHSVAGQVRSVRSKLIRDNRDGNGYIRCEVTGLKIKPKDMHLDHYPLQFEEIVDMWFKRDNLTISSFKIKPPKGVSTCWILPPDVAASFIKFHLEIAEYRMVLDKVNLQRSKSGVKLEV